MCWSRIMRCWRRNITASLQSSWSCKKVFGIKYKMMTLGPVLWFWDVYGALTCTGFLRRFISLNNIRSCKCAASFTSLIWYTKNEKENYLLSEISSLMLHIHSELQQLSTGAEPSKGDLCTLFTTVYQFHSSTLWLYIKYQFLISGRF